MIHLLRNLGLLATTLLFIGISRVEAKVCPGDTLYTQAEVDAFAASGCDTIDGNLLIDGSGITDLSGLDHIKFVDGHLGIYNTGVLAIREAFSQLYEVSGDLFIEENLDLGAISEHAFPLLSEVGGGFFVYGNDAMFRLEGFKSLSYIGGDTYIADNLLLGHISDFKALVEIEGDLKIKYNGLLGELDGFPALKRIDGDLLIEANDVLKSITGFGALESIETLSIAYHPALERITGFGAITSVAGDFNVYANYNLVNFGGFYALQTVLGNMYIGENPALQYLTDFPALTSLVSLYLEYNVSLEQLSGFLALSTISGNLTIVNNEALQGISGFGELTSVSGDVQIIQNEALTSVSGIGKLSSVGGNFLIQYNEQLSSITAFSSLGTVAGVMSFVTNGVEDLDGFNSLTSVDQLDIISEPHLKQITGFQSLSTIAGSLLIQLNPLLKEIHGFNALRTVGSIDILENEFLKTIDGFNGLTSVTNDLNIVDNAILVYIKGFEALTTIGNDLLISLNPLLESIHAFTALESVNTLGVLTNPSLIYCCGLSNVISVGGYAVEAIAGNSPGCNSAAEIDAICNAVLSDCVPNCKANVNVSLDINGVGVLRPTDIITDTMSCMDGLEFTVRTDQGYILFGPQVVGMNGAFPVKACAYLHHDVYIEVKSNTGGCTSNLTFKQITTPTIPSDTIVTVLCDDPLVNGPLPGTVKPAWIPCQPEMYADYVTDWIVPFECEPGVNDTVKIIYREWEAFDKDGNRGVAFDTIVVVQFPEITADNIYCEEKDTVFCADTTANVGPYITYMDPVNGCVEEYLISVKDADGDGMLEFIPKKFDPKCGLAVFVDYKKFVGDCENNYLVTVEIKQSCYGPASTACTVPVPAGTLPNRAEQLAPGYWICEFWVADLDTLAPEVVCKGNEFFTGPFDIDNFDLYNGFFGIGVPPDATAEKGPAIGLGSNFDLSGLPYVLEIESFNNLLLPSVGAAAAPSEPNNLFFPATFASNAVVGYEATEDLEFGFTWDFTLDSNLTGPIAPPMVEGLYPGLVNAAGVSIFYSLNGASFRLVDGVPLEDVFGLGNQPPNLLKGSEVVGSPDAIDPVLVQESQHGFTRIPMRAGDMLYIVALWDSPVDATFRIMGNNIVSTSGSDCAAHTYIPPVYTHDDWSGIKSVKARVGDLGSFVLDYDAEEDCWVSHENIHLPLSEFPYKITYEVYDSCHNMGYDSCYIIVKDLVPPVPVVDKGVTVSLGDKKVWVNAESFDERTQDNCALNFLLVRRADWYEACMDLCDSIYPVCVNEHYDTIWKPWLQPDKHVDEVEAHYAKTLAWLYSEGGECSELLYNAWQYDLMKRATMHCVEHPYDLSDFYFTDLVNDCRDSLWECFKGVPLHPGPEPFTRRLTPDLIQTYEAIGGGWSDQVVFTCEDACGPVTVEVLAMDYWCNYSIAWTEVWVEDKVPADVAKDVVSELEITCKSFRTDQYHLNGVQDPVNLQYVVDQATIGNEYAYEVLDSVFGGYEKAWIDPYGNYVDQYGNELDCDITFYDSVCYCTTDVKQIRVYDEHLGYYWKDSLVTDCYYEVDSLEWNHGVIAVNCADNVHCKQEVWSEIDHCGEGYIIRKFKIWQNCADSVYTYYDLADSMRHPVDTIVRSQRIWVGNRCELSKYMFDVPGDTTIYHCGVEYDPAGSGELVGVAGPEYTGYATYKFDDDCRLVGIAHEDKVFKVVGGEEACYKIIRTWYFADWCGTGGEPVKDDWWYDNELILDSCVQKILVVDSVPPVCTITGPVTSGGFIEVGACTYTMDVTVHAEDACGITQYYWELKDISNANAIILHDSGDETLTYSDSIASFDIISEGLLPGQYLLKVKVQDECNNESICEYYFNLVSVKKPTPICITSLTARLTPWDSDFDGEVDSAHAVVWANEFDQSSMLACEDTLLEFRIDLLDGVNDDSPELALDSLDLTCDDIGGNMVRMWVVSQPSNTIDYCDVLLVVQSDYTGCNPSDSDSSGVAFSTGTEVINVKKLVKKNPGRTPINIPADAGNDLGTYETGFYLDQNQPNPFRSETNIGFVLPASMSASVVIYDVTGRQVKEVQGDFMRGYNQITVRKSELTASGVMYYRLTAEGFSATKKMIILD